MSSTTRRLTATSPAIEMDTSEPRRITWGRARPFSFLFFLSFSSFFQILALAALLAPAASPAHSTGFWEYQMRRSPATRRPGRPRSRHFFKLTGGRFVRHDCPCLVCTEAGPSVQRTSSRQIQISFPTPDDGPVAGHARRARVSGRCRVRRRTVAGALAGLHSPFRPSGGRAVSTGRRGARCGHRAPGGY